MDRKLQTVINVSGPISKNMRDHTYDQSEDTQCLNLKNRNIKKFQKISTEKNF